MANKDGCLDYVIFLQQSIIEDQAMIASGEGLIAAHWPSLPQGVVDFSAGFGDALLLGYGDDIRDYFGIGSVNMNSSYYDYGGYASYAVPYAGYKAMGYAFKFMRYENAGGYGFTWLRNGKRSFGIDNHPIPKLVGHNKNVWHFHAGRTGNQVSKHRPYQGGWKWW